jgi:hypothetical protein
MNVLLPRPDGPHLRVPAEEAGVEAERRARIRAGNAGNRGMIRLGESLLADLTIAG